MGRKGCAMCQYYLLYNEVESGSEGSNEVDPLKVTLEDIDALWINLTKFVSPQDVKVRKLL